MFRTQDSIDHDLPPCPACKRQDQLEVDGGMVSCTRCKVRSPLSAWKRFKHDEEFSLTLVAKWLWLIFVGTLVAILLGR